MLISRITDPYMRFRTVTECLTPEEGRGLARGAFRHVLATRNALKCQKNKILREIYGKCPGILKEISDAEMIGCLERLRDFSLVRGESISTAELDWVNIYVQTPEARARAEMIVYSVVLLGSDHWDRIRQEYPWVISEDVCAELIRQALKDKSLGSKRKMELAKEIGQSHEEFARAYAKKLLWDRHYDLAAGVPEKTEEDIITVIVKDLDAGYFQDALEIAECFLPLQPDVAGEIRQIMSCFKD